MTIPIRNIRAEDVEEFKALRLEALRLHPSSFGSDYEENLNATESFWDDRIRPALKGKGQIFLADAGDELAGMAGVLREGGAKVDHSAFIWGVYVREKYRGEGLSPRLIHAAVEWCAAEKIRIARLTVVTTNAAAIRCYLGCGFEVCGVEREVIRVGEKYHDELHMWRRV